VVIATARTPKDENVENQPENTPQPSPTQAGIASITLLNRIDSENEEELESRQFKVF
jgi:hypothetical protein